jgi:ABC-type branched-subunit amino acid transport system substrate-binding protein
LIVLDDQGQPARAATNAKRLIEDEKVLAMQLISVSATYAGAFKSARDNRTSLILSGMSVCPSQVFPPNTDPYVYCAGFIATGPEAQYAIPFAKRRAQQAGQDLKLGLVAMDVPVSRQGVDEMEQVARAQRINLVDKVAVPPTATDVKPVAARFVQRGANWIVTWAPISLSIQMVKALRSLGWDGFYLGASSADAEQVLQTLKDPKFGVYASHAFTVEPLPVFKEMRAAAGRFGVKERIENMTGGWISGMVLEAALRKCGAGCDRARLHEALDGLNVDTKGLYPTPLEWTKKSHIRSRLAYTVYAWNAQKGQVERLEPWTPVDAK